MKFLILSLMIVSSAQALTIKEGSYESERCFVEVTKTSQGGSYVEIASKANDNTLEREVMVIDDAGDLIDGPGLCTDELTMGRNSRSKISIMTIGSNGAKSTTIKCGGLGFPITLEAKIVTNAKSELVSFIESSATKQLLVKKTRKMDCGKLKMIK